MTCSLLSEQACLATLDLPPSLLGVMKGIDCASCECCVLRRVEEVGDDPGLGGWPAPLGFRWASVVWALADCCIRGHLACYLISVLRHPRVMTPTVAPERFCDHEVIMKALMRVCIGA